MKSTSTETANAQASRTSPQQFIEQGLLKDAAQQLAVLTGDNLLAYARTFSALATTAIQKAEQEPTPNLERGHCVVAVSPNSWGRGETVAEALKQLVKAGGSRGRAQLRCIVGDAKAYVSDMGDLMIHNGAISYKI